MVPWKCKTMKRPPIKNIEGDKVDLQPFSKNFISNNYLNWMNDKDTTRFIEKAKDIDFGNGACPAMHCDELRQIPELWKFMTIRRVGRLPNKL